MSKQESVSQFNFSIDQEKFKFSVAVFALVGLTLGLTGAFAISFFSGDGGSGILSGLLLAVVLTVGFLLGPVIATIVGLWTTLHSDTDSDIQYTTNAASSFVGYIVMILILAIVLTVAIAVLSGGGGGGAGGGGTGQGSGVPLGDLLLPLIGFAIPTGLMGLAATWVASRYTSTAPAPESGPAAQGPQTAQTAGGTTTFETTDMDIPGGNPLPRIREAVDDVSYGLGAGLGVFSILITSAFLLLIIAVDPSLSAVDESLFGFGIIPIYPPNFGLRDPSITDGPSDILTWFSWMALLAHGVTIDGLTFELSRMGLFRTVPWLVLLLSGYTVARIRESDSSVDAFVNGSSVVIGYVIPIFALALLASTNVDQFGEFVDSQTVSVNVISALVKAGIFYPIVFGGVGGILRYFRTTSGSEAPVEDDSTA